MKPSRAIRTIFVLCTLGLATPAFASPVVVFSTNFESGIPPEISAPGAGLYGVEGYAGLGPAGRQFGGNFLRYTSVPIFPTTLTVRNLPPHESVSVKFLLGLIDSWDGTELMQISVDGSLRFNHWFQLATGDTTDYFPAPAGAILSMGHELGFSIGSYYARDRAYDLGVDPAFLNVPHTADSVVVTWTIGAVSGPAASQWQGGSDESWAIDAISIEVTPPTADVATELAPGRLGLAGAFPNPARGGAVQLRFSLPDGAPASVELLDLAGRRVAAREVGSLGAGPHSVSLSAGERIPPGVYFARLSRGSVARVKRVVVID